jgi:ATP-dependent Clp protease protease subunit
MNKRSQFHAELGSDGVLELTIYGDIVDAVTAGYLESWGYDPSSFVSALSVKKALDAAPTASKIRMRINSPGGDAFEGMAIHSLLTGQPKPVEAYIDGIAASSASVIAMAAATRVMGRSAMMMVHNAWASSTGYASDMRKMADVLDKISESIGACYIDRTGMDAKTVQKLMDAETWLSAQDCVDQKFATAVVESPADEKKAMARARRFAALARLRNVPTQFKAAACACDCNNCVNGNCDECTNADCDDTNCADCPMQNGGAGNSARVPVTEPAPTMFAAREAVLAAAKAKDEMEMKRARHKARTRK